MVHLDSHTTNWIFMHSTNVLIASSLLNHNMSLHVVSILHSKPYTHTHNLFFSAPTFPFLSQPSLLLPSLNLCLLSYENCHCKHVDKWPFERRHFFSNKVDIWEGLQGLLYSHFSDRLSSRQAPQASSSPPMMALPWRNLFIIVAEAGFPKSFPNTHSLWHEVWLALDVPGTAKRFSVLR